MTRWPRAGPAELTEQLTVVTAYEALRGFTLDAACAGFAEREVGSLEAGKRADFLVLAQDPLAKALPLRFIRAASAHGVAPLSPVTGRKWRLTM